MAGRLFISRLPNGDQRSPDFRLSGHYPKALVRMVTNASSITSHTIESLLNSYFKDDVYSKSFLDGISHLSLGWSSYLQIYIGLQIISTLGNASIDSSASVLLSSLNLSYLLVDSCIPGSISSATTFTKSSITPPVPYRGKISSGSLSFLGPTRHSTTDTIAS